MLDRNECKLLFANFLNSLFRHAYFLNCVSQKDIAEILEIDPSNLSRYLSGVVSPSSSIVAQILSLFSESSILGKSFIRDHFNSFLSSL